MNEGGNERRLVVPRVGHPRLLGGRRRVPIVVVVLVLIVLVVSKIERIASYAEQVAGPTRGLADFSTGAVDAVRRLCG